MAKTKAKSFRVYWRFSANVASVVNAGNFQEAVELVQQNALNLVEVEADEVNDFEDIEVAGVFRDD